MPAVRDGRIVKEAFPTGLPKSFSGLVFNTRRPVFCRHPRARGDRPAVRLRMDQPQLLLRPLPALRELLRGLRAVGARPAGRCARARAARAVSRRGARRHPGGHLAAAGHRRLRPRPRHAQARARAASRPPATSSTARCCATRATGEPFDLRNPGHHPGPGAAGARLLARPQARRHHGARARRRRRAIRPAATHLRLRHDRDTAGTSRCRPATSRPSIGAPPPPTPTARATTWASRARRSTP